MKEILYGHRIRQNRELLRLAQQRNVELEEVVAQSAFDVSAEWDRSEDAMGRPVIILRLWDYTGSATTVFEPKELESPDHMRSRFRFLWGDLLQVRSAKQLQVLQEAGGLEGA